MAEPNGKPAATVGQGNESEPLAERQARAWDVVTHVQDRNADLSPDDVLAEVTAEVEAARQERYERRARTETSRRRS